MSDLAALIARLETAEHGSFALEREIWRAVVPERFVHEDDKPPAYTVSLDAALTLVPEGWRWQVSNRATEPHRGRAYINNREPICGGVSGMIPNPDYRGYECTAATPVLALCIAALKAMAR